LSVRIKDKKIHSTPLQRRLDLLAGEVEKLREQIKKKLQQLEELQRILNSQNTFRSEELPSEVERLIIELQKVAKLSPSRKIPELLEANASMQKSLATAEEEHRKILMTLLSVLRRRLETSQKRLGKFQYVASLLIGWRRRGSKLGSSKNTCRACLILFPICWERGLCCRKSL
jgi:TolA-binding protein